MDEHDRPALDEAPRPVAANVDPRRYYAVIGALVAVIIVLAVRPWDAPGASPRLAGTPEGGRASPAGSPLVGAATPARTQGLTGLESELQVTCGWPSDWRAATLQTWSGRDQPVRSWMAIEPVEASGPGDPAIPFAPIFTDAVQAIGFCSPPDEQRPPSGAVGHLFLLDAGRARQLAPVVIEPSLSTARGVLWAPGSTYEAPGTSRVWPPGRYVIEVASPQGSYRWWLGIEIHDLDALRSGPPVTPSPLPTPAPGVTE